MLLYGLLYFFLFFFLKIFSIIIKTYKVKENKVTVFLEVSSSTQSYVTDQYKSDRQVLPSIELV